MIASAIEPVGFGRTFGNVERNRHGRSPELVGERCIPTWDAFGHDEREGKELDAPLVNVEALVVQHAPPIGQPGPSVSVYEHEHVHEYEDVHEYEYKYEGKRGSRSPT
jgi:hypothetical protein